tara:strand:+ start:2156 stop:2641 length:486 start_codon:yes stop_codon:yes gene_type:complete
MPNYQNGKIYKIIDNTNRDIYIGSTTQALSQRIAGHRNDYKQYLNGISRYYKSFDIIENDDYKIILIENHCCNNKEELLMREGYYIDNNNCINKKRAFISKEEKKEYNRKWQTDNKEERKEYQKQYQKSYYKYKNSWGGCNNNLLSIDLDIFLFNAVYRKK